MSLAAFTTERLQKAQPATYDAIVHMMATGFSTRETSEATGVHFITVFAIKDHATLAIEELRARLREEILSKLGGAR